MKQKPFLIRLTNGTVEDDYHIIAFNEREAVILAQAQAIRLVKGYDLVYVIGEDKK